MLIQINFAFQKGSIVVKCSDVDSESFGQVIYVVDSYQLLQKYVMEADDIVFGRVFVKTGRVGSFLKFIQKDLSFVDGCAMSRGPIIS